MEASAVLVLNPDPTTWACGANSARANEVNHPNTLMGPPKAPYLSRSQFSPRRHVRFPGPAALVNQVDALSTKISN